MGLMDLLLNEPSTMDKVLGILSTTGASGPQASMGSTMPGPDSSLNLLTRRGVTLDADALHSLQQARRAGFNAFPFIGSDYRSNAEQAQMYANRGSNPFPVAPPGQSMHNEGLAFDAGDLPSRIASYLEQNGWYNGASFGDPVHYSYGSKG
jgi:hypothetical protein